MGINISEKYGDSLMSLPLPRPMPASGVVVEQLNDDFPVPLAMFAARLVGTPDEVWTGVLRLHHKREKHSELEWYRLIDSHRDART